MPLLKFSEHDSTTHRAIVVSFDLAGFSSFCNQSEPAVALTVPRLVKHTFGLLNGFFSDRDEAAVYGLIKPSDDGKLPQPTLNKFTGDGALMAWLRP